MNNKDMPTKRERDEKRFLSKAVALDDEARALIIRSLGYKQDVLRSRGWKIEKEDFTTIYSLGSRICFDNADEALETE